MKKRIGILCISMLLGGMCLAQEAVSGAPNKEDVMKFMDLMHVRQQMTQLMDGMKQSARVGAEAGFKQEIPNPTSDQLEKVDALADVVFGDMPIGEIIDAMIPIYQKHISKADLNAIVAFYSSPVGQRLLEEQPAILSEAMEAGQGIMLQKLPAMQERLKASVTKFANEELAKANDQKKPTAN